MKSSPSPTRRRRILRGCAGILLALAPCAIAAPATFEDAPTEGYGWFVRAGGRALFGVKSSVRRLPASAPSRGMFDNGYVLPDIRGTGTGRTWNWGYTDAAQVAGNQLNLQRFTDLPMAGLYDNRGEDAIFGGEIFTGAELARFFIGRREARLGFEIGYAYHAFSADEHSTAQAHSTLDLAAYNLGTTFAPPAPYAGSYAGPGPEIDLEPSLSGTLSSPSTATFRGELDNTLHTFKLGLWLEYPLARQLRAGLSVGYASMFVDSQLAFTENITFANPGILPLQTGPRTIGDRKWKAGAYAQARFSYDLKSWLGVYAAGDFETHNSHRYRDAGREVTLDLDTLFAASVGAVIRF
ncbi:MAG: hypothetical protein JXQ71_03910 [Verrucomicrobia bacterium]|nr:hypothetical protein [Verrucomicrobiota bacterium]